MTGARRWRRAPASALDLAGPARWRDLAACLGQDLALFFPVGETGPATSQVQQAKRVCEGCPVRERCLAWALDSGTEHGVWGGMTDTERRALRRRSARRARR